MSEPRTASESPFSTLDPNCVLDALESVGLRPDGRMIALASYENRVYQIWMDEGPPVVAKFYRPGRWQETQLREEHAFAAELLEAEIPVVAPLALAGDTLHRHGGFWFAVSPRRGGRPPELDDTATLTRIGRFLGRLHACGGVRPFVARPAIDVARLGRAPRDWLLASGLVPPELRVPWQTIVDLALEGASVAFERAGDFGTIRLHGDCHPGNILWSDDGPHFVDLDDCANGPAIQDLWMLISGERADRQRQLGALLDGYEDFAELDRRELGLVEALRTLRLIHYAAWLGQRRADPAFPAAFPWFGTQRWWEEQVLALREQVAAMQEPPLAV